MLGAQRISTLFPYTTLFRSENLISPADVSVQVNDTIDDSTLSLSDAAVNDVADINITATVDNAPQGSDLVISLDNGQIITILAGQTTGSVTFANPNGEDPYL